MENTCECPVCMKSFPSTTIEEHVNKCLFLNSSDSDIMKRKEQPKKKDLNDTPPKKQRTLLTLAGTSKNNPILSALNREPSPVLDSFHTTQQVQENGHSKQQPPPPKKNKQDKLNFTIPLADMVRPKTIDEFFGQTNILGEKAPLRNLLSNKQITNMILWGPPGCGKTSLAEVVKNICKEDQTKFKFSTLNAADVGVKEVKEIIEASKNYKKFGKRTVLFMDEIHRFNKRQQDTFLSCVEKGDITLIGATTENPSFSLNNPLLSRCRVIVFQKLSSDDLMCILKKALGHLEIEILESDEEVENCEELIVHTSALKYLADLSDGDARIALSNLQLILQYHKSPENMKVIKEEDIKDVLTKSQLLYDKKGEEHYNVISAMHKSIRGSDVNAALYWTTRMIISGEDPMFIARRMVRAASEDIGNADPTALQLAISTMQGVQLLGMPEADVLLAQCAIYLARAPKSREADSALAAAKHCINNHKGPQPSVPLHIRNAPTRLMKDLGYGRLQNGDSFTFLPKGYENVNFFE